MAQLENIEAIEKRLWKSADTLRANSELAREHAIKPLSMRQSMLWCAEGYPWITNFP